MTQLDFTAPDRFGVSYVGLKMVNALREVDSRV